MIRFVLRIAYVVLAAAACSVAVFAPGCSSDDAAAPATDASASTNSPDANVCGDPALARNGGRCYPVADIRCFPLCTKGGCTCKVNPADPNGDAGIWSCVSDVSCLPDSAPIDDLDSGPLDDSGEIDDASDAGSDDAGDADAS